MAVVPWKRSKKTMSSSGFAYDLLNSIGYKEVDEILHVKSFWAEYEPVIDIKRSEIFGYEALARFVYRGQNIPPAPIFEIAHYSQELFFQLEKALKIMQIEHRPKEGILFVNIDPHNFNTAEKNDFWSDLFSSTEQMCIEVTENTDAINASLLADILPKLKKTGAYIAQDDIGNDAKPFCFELTNHAHILKFDRTWLHKIRACSDYVQILKGFIAFARLQKKKTVMEGIETKEDFAIAKRLGVDFVQGYLFKTLNLKSPHTL